MRVYLLASLLLASCSYDVGRAKQSAQEFSTNIPGATGISCVATDSNDDGYCSCTVFRGEKAPVALECGCETMCLRCAEGCKVQNPLTFTGQQP